MKVVSNIFNFIHPDTLLIDKIVITYNPSISEREHILSAVKNIGWLQSWADKQSKKTFTYDLHKAYIKPSRLYKSSIDISIPDDAFTDNNIMCLELDPKDKGKSFLRLEYNPSKIPFSILSACLNDIMPNGVDCIFEKGRVTRLDIAMDIKDVKPYQIILDYVKSRYRLCYLESGRPDSIYIGKDTGVNQVYMYDKSKELKEHKVKTLSAYKLPDYDLTRIELRHRPKPSLSVLQLLQLDNLLYHKLYVFGTPPEVKGDADFNIKRDLCVLKGLRQVGRQLKKSGDFDGFVDKLEKYAVIDFLELQKLWGTLPFALKQVYPHLNTVMNSISKS